MEKKPDKNIFAKSDKWGDLTIEEFTELVSSLVKTHGDKLSFELTDEKGNEKEISVKDF